MSLTFTTLRPDYDAMVSSSYDLQTAMNQSALSGLSSLNSGVGKSYLKSLVSSYNQAYQQAKSANEQRYQQMLAIADSTTGQRQADIRSDYSGQQASAMQNLARLGMANTTVAPTLTAGIERQKQAALNTAADELQKTKLGIIESREDTYPDASILSSLVSQIGSAYGGGGLSSMLGALSNLKF